ncbi:MAG: hypothetical protein NTZ33_06375 [Bacteroidetes bacterium]|nr:hypothetical protein [Bacteroidota bacterium]
MFFENTEEVQKFLPVSNNVDFARLKPHITQIEDEFIFPLLGESIADVKIYLAKNTADEKFDPLLFTIQNAVAHLMYWRGYDVLNAYISDGGFKRIESDKVKSLFKYQEDNLRDYFKNIAFNSLDSMLEKLEIFQAAINQNAKATSWYKALHDDFINNAKDFSTTYDIGNSRLIFLRLKKHMQLVKDLQLSKVFGAVNWAYLLSELSKMDDASPAAKVKAVLPLCSKALAFLSVALLMEESGADLTDKGLVYEGSTSQNNAAVAKFPSDIERVNKLISRNRNIGEAYLKELKNYLLKNSLDWNGYIAPKNGVLNRDNGGRKCFFA